MNVLSRVLAGLWLIAIAVSGQETKPADMKPLFLPPPQIEGGRPLMQVLKERKTGREFSTDGLPIQMLSNLLWAAWGVNRDDGRRTAPSSRNRQEIDVYVALAEGLFLYNAKDHRLDPILVGDVRAATAGKQPWAGQAPLSLVYVADQAKMGGPDDATAFVDTGFISQNVYLYSASEGLATVVHEIPDRVTLGKAMKLRPEQRITLAQAVGYPKKAQPSTKAVRD